MLCHGATELAREREREREGVPASQALLMGWESQWGNESVRVIMGEGYGIPDAKFRASHPRTQSTSRASGVPFLFQIYRFKSFKNDIYILCMYFRQ